MIGCWLCDKSFAEEFSHECHVGLDELMLVAVAWLSETWRPNWDNRCDIKPVDGDGMIDIKYYYSLSLDWLMQKELKNA
jgi:hypothetical protein